MKNKLSIAIGLILALVLTIGIFMVKEAPKPMDLSKKSNGERRFYLAIDRSLDIVKDLSKYKQAKAQGLGFERSFLMYAIKNGIKHLENTDIDKWHFYRFKMAKLSEPYCAGILTGKMTPKIIFKAFENLNDKELVDFTNVLLVGAKRHILDRGDPVTDMSFLQSAIKEIIKQSSENDKDKLSKIMNDPLKFDQKDQCWATIELMYQMKNITSSVRYRALKMLSGGI